MKLLTLFNTPAFPSAPTAGSDASLLSPFRVQCIFGQMRCDPEDHYFLLTEPPLNAPENREYTAEIMFETFNCSGLYIAVQVRRSLLLRTLINSMGLLPLQCWRIEILSAEPHIGFLLYVHLRLGQCHQPGTHSRDFATSTIPPVRTLRGQSGGGESGRQCWRWRRR